MDQELDVKELDQDTHVSLDQVLIRLLTYSNSHDFQCSFFTLAKTKRSEVCQHLNSSWKAVNVDEKFKKEHRENPKTFQPVVQYIGNRLSGNRFRDLYYNRADDVGENSYEDNVALYSNGKIRNNNGSTIIYTKSEPEIEFIVDTALSIEFDFRKYLTDGDQSYNLLIDPIYALRTFPNVCWGFNFQQIYNEFKFNKSWRKFSINFNKGRFVEFINTMYPNLIPIEKGVLRFIEKYNNEDEETSDDEEVKEKGNDKEKEGNHYSIVKNWIELFYPRRQVLLGTEFKKTRTDSIERVLPVVLLPFFLYAQMDKRNGRSNPSCLLSLEIVEALSQHRNYLYFQLQNPSFGGDPNVSLKLSCLDLTIKQLKQNVESLIYFVEQKETDQQIVLAQQLMQIKERIDANEMTLRNSTKRSNSKINKIMKLKKVEDLEQEVAKLKRKKKE